MKLLQELVKTSTLIFSITAAAAAAGTAHAASTSVVLVHGALADSSVWSKVIPLLQRKGLDVVSVRIPLSSLADDVAATKRAIDAQLGNVVLVGHSWSGAVITEAGNSDKVKSLVYLAAYAPDVGQSTADMGKNHPPAPGFAHVKVDAAGYLSISKEGMSKHFAQDLPLATTALMAVTQGPIQTKAFEQKLSAAAWKSKPSWYLVADADHMMQPAFQLEMAKNIGARVTHVNTGHVPQLSQPNAVAALILEAAALPSK
jgi:pimeloyl-ACP methyl ester carboxylesterase